MVVSIKIIRSIDGPGEVVEIDKSIIARRKNNVGWVVEQW